MIVRRVSRNDEQERAAIHRIVEVGATLVTNTFCLHHLNEDQELTINRTDAMQRELTTTRAEVRELREHHVSLERRMFEKKLQLAKTEAEASRKTINTPCE